MDTLRRKKIANRKKNMAYTLLVLPGLIYLVLFRVLPMSGMVLAFKDYNHIDGIWGSQWNGFENFRFFFESSDAGNVLRNTIGYSLVIMICLNLIGGMIVAILLYEVKSPRANKIYQMAMLVPNFISWVAISFIAYRSKHSISINNVKTGVYKNYNFNIIEC